MMEREKIYTDKMKKVREETAVKTVKVTMTIIKVIFIIIIVYTVVASLYLIFTSETGRKDFLTNMVTLSVGGFWAFFLGYFGWRMGQTIEIYFLNLKKKK
jgi:Trk-type K+ transport system membrane component